MKSSLHVSCLQIPITWNNAKINRQYIENQIATLTNTDIVVLPETFTTGFAVENLLAETMQGETIQWMIYISKKYKIAIIGSLFITQEKKTYNRMLFSSPDGSVQHYDKWHLFGLGNEGKLLTKGTSLPIFSYLGWKIKPLICYDLRFPVTTRNTQNYDIIVCIANWPKPRIDAWNTLLKARAIENLCYVIGVNRTGTDGYNNVYNGNSNTYDPTGKALLETSNSQSIQNVILEKSSIALTRSKFPFLEDRDTFSLK